jgi:hypothetical protein
MSLEHIRGALETRLATITPAIGTVWDNAAKPTTAARDPWQRCRLITAEPLNDEISPSYIERGYLSVELNYPSLAGSGAADARAELIRTTFKRGLTLTQGGVETTIDRTPQIGPGFTDADAKWVVPVRIRFMTPINVSP